MQYTGMQKKFPKRNTQQGIVEEDLLWSGRPPPPPLQENLNYNCQWSTKGSRLFEDAKWFISHSRRASSMWRRRNFQQDSAAIHNASITNKYLLEQKKLDFLTTQRLSRRQFYSKCVVIDCCKIYEGDRQYAAISELKNTILDAWGNTISSI